MREGQTAVTEPAHALKDRLAEFVAPASIEITPHDEGSLQELQRLLPAGATVYVAHTPKLDLKQVVKFAVRVQELGFKASAHIAARGLRSEAQLREALQELQDAGCDRILLIAGDYATPAGPFPSTIEVLDSGVTVEYGMTTLAVAGHPEGNPVIGEAALAAALDAKQAFAARTGTNLFILTQFGFNPEAVLTWSRQLYSRGIKLPIHVGLAGPTPLPKLIRYAMRCGIGASLRTLTQKSNGLASIANLAQVNTTPDEVLLGLVASRDASQPEAIAQPHFFSFGGCVETAQWLRTVREGHFRMRSDGSGIQL